MAGSVQPEVVLNKGCPPKLAFPKKRAVHFSDTALSLFNIFSAVPDPMETNLYFIFPDDCRPLHPYIFSNPTFYRRWTV